MNPTRIAFIGLGNMGRPMAARLVRAGHALTVFDVNRSAAEGVLALGAAWAGSPADAARECSVVCTSLPGPDEARAVYFGNDGILTATSDGMIGLDFTTNAPAVVREIHAAVARRGGQLLDVPVSGGVEGAEQGSLTMLAGGDAEAVDAVRPILEQLGKSVVHVGPVGAASVCKLLHNCAVLGANLATVECLTAGVKAGVDAATLVRVFQESGLGRNLDLQVAMPKTLFQGNFEPRFALSTAYKDMRLATQLASDSGVPMKMAEFCLQDMAEAVGRGWQDRDNTIYLTIQEERAGAAIRTSQTQGDRTQARELE